MEELAILAPFPGLARLEANGSINLKLEGGFRLGSTQGKDPVAAREIQARSGDREEAFSFFLHLLKDSGIPVSDEPGHTLFQQFEKISQLPQVQLILSKLDGQGGINWPYLFQNRSPGLKEMSELLTAILPEGSKVHIFPQKKIPAGAGNGGVWFPGVTAARVLNGIPGGNFHSSLLDRGILVMGPATLWALMDLLYENKFFHSRLVAVRFHKSLNHISNVTRIYRIPVGFPLMEFLRERFGFQDRTWRVQGGAIPQSGFHEMNLSDLALFLPFGETVLNLSRKNSSLDTPVAAACTGCYRCERVCPVNASPLSLLTGNRKAFALDRCLVCGICEQSCESRIPLMERIRELKNVPASDGLSTGRSIYRSGGGGQ